MSEKERQVLKDKMVKGKYVKNCRGCGVVIYGWHTPDFCCSTCEYNFEHKEGDRK